MPRARDTCSATRLRIAVGKVPARGELQRPFTNLAKDPLQLFVPVLETKTSPKKMPNLLCATRGRQNKQHIALRTESHRAALVPSGSRHDMKYGICIDIFLAISRVLKHIQLYI